eukprot:4413456-Amphidinium_carterae.1
MEAASLRKTVGIELGRTPPTWDLWLSCPSSDDSEASPSASKTCPWRLAWCCLHHSSASAICLCFQARLACLTAAVAGALERLLERPEA